MVSAFFDIQVNGFAGIDFQNPNLGIDDLRRATDALLEHRIRKIFLTLVTDEIGRLEDKLRNIERMRLENPQIAGVIAGYHLEGPYLSPEEGFRGAHPARLMKAPSIDEYQRLQEASGGNIRLLTISPELPGSGKFIRAVVGAGTEVSIGHSNATREEIDMAVANGARFCTHLGNGVPKVLDRHDNVIQRLLATDELTAFFIPDGIHLPWNVLRNFYRAKPPGKALFTSDCMAAAAAPPGTYTLGELSLEVSADGVVHLPGSGLFAGSSLCLDQAPDRLSTHLGLPLQEAHQLCGEAIAAAFAIPLD